MHNNKQSNVDINSLDEKELHLYVMEAIFDSYFMHNSNADISDIVKRLIDELSNKSQKNQLYEFLNKRIPKITTIYVRNLYGYQGPIFCKVNYEDLDKNIEKMIKRLQNDWKVLPKITNLGVKKSNICWLCNK